MTTLKDLIRSEIKQANESLRRDESNLFEYEENLLENIMEAISQTLIRFIG